MKKLNITKEQFNRSRYFQRKYGKLEYVSESGKLFKTNKGNVLKFNESEGMGLSPDELDDELSAELDADEIKNDDFYDRGLKRAMKDYGKKIARYAKAEAKPQLIGCKAEIESLYVKPEKKEIWYIINIRRASKKDNLDYSDIDDAFIENMYDVMFKSYGEFSGWEFPYEQYCDDGVMENGNALPIAIGIKIDMDKVKVSKRHVDDARWDYLTGYEESTKKFGRKFNERMSARKKIQQLQSGELYQKQMPFLKKAIQKFIDRDGTKGQAGTWVVISDEYGITIYEDYGYRVGSIIDGHMEWRDDEGYYVSAKYSEMILNALYDGGLIERDECQRAIQDAYASEEEYEREYGESTRRARRFNESMMNEGNEYCIGIRLRRGEKWRGEAGVYKWLVEQFDPEDNEWSVSLSIDGTEAEALSELKKEARTFIGACETMANHRG